jgi:predicted dehydrogenase
LFFPREIEAVSAHCDASSAIVATLRQDDTTIVLEVARSVAGRWLEGAEFLFEHGRVRLVIPSPMATDKVSEVLIDDQRRNLADERINVGGGWSFARQAAGFVDALTGAQPPATSGEDSLADMILIEQIWRRMTG